jgi:hypothetical protein
MKLQKTLVQSGRNDYIAPELLMIRVRADLNYCATGFQPVADNDPYQEDTDKYGW